MSEDRVGARSDLNDDQQRAISDFRFPISDFKNPALRAALFCGGDFSVLH
jgi:hypothetical protein